MSILIFILSIFKAIYHENTHLKKVNIIHEKVCRQSFNIMSKKLIIFSIQIKYMHFISRTQI